MGERKARHLVSYFANRYLDHFERDLEEMRDHGFDTVVHCVTEADREWGMKRMAEMFHLTREAGLSCWVDPWGVAGVFGGEAHSRYLGRGGTFGADDVVLQALLHDWIDGVATAGAEWVFWDEPDLGLGHTPDALVPFLDGLATYARGRGLRNSICLTATPPNLPAFRELAALESIDDVGTDPYYGPELADRDPDPEDHVGKWADRARDAAEENGKTSHLWVQAFHIAAGVEHRIARCIEVARAHGVSGIGVWGFRACEALDIRPERPELAWRVVGDALAPERARARA